MPILPKKLILTFAVSGIFLVAVGGFLVYFLWYAPRTSTEPWFAVHLTNSEVVIGHILSYTPNDITVTNAYFLKTLKKIDQRTQTEPGTYALDPSAPPLYNLIPRTDNPTLKTDGSMVIDRRAVLFWEKLTEDSEAVRTLNKSN
ncbi:hypothetical protein HY504_02280 [Candidatus Wolfebacteria bacterium]|nr:hypothetical protein [Candidatus Wolfebacteria bacterium]